MRRFFPWKWALALIALFVAGEVPAQWPERPITLVVMYSPGGGTDTVLRTLAAEMANAFFWTGRC